MFSILFGSAFIIIALIATWAYIPIPARQKTVAFIASATGVGPEGATAFAEILTSVSPEKRREALLGQLKKQVEEIKKTAPKENTPPASTAEIVSEKTVSPENSLSDPIAAAEEIIKKLEEVNDDKGVKETITEKILETILQPSKSLECKAEDK